MTYTKTILFLIVAMILPFSMMDVFATETKQIQKPTETQNALDMRDKVLELFNERISLDKEQIEIQQFQKWNPISVIDKEKQDKKLEKIKERLSEISVDFGKINADSRELFAMTPLEKIVLLEQKQIVRDSNIPYYGLGTDKRVGALTIGFQSQEIADKYIPKLDKILDVPYYIEISNGYRDYDCLTKGSDCDPLMGGIEIGTQKTSSTWSICTISVPLSRNISGGTEEGFVTAAHCFNNGMGNDAKQPSGGSKVGDVTKTQNSGKCDCAFVKKSSSEDTFFGNWNGYNSSNQLTSKNDALEGDHVVMMGRTTVATIGTVVDDSFDVPSSPAISNAHKVDIVMAAGDSGGTVIDLNTKSVYHGLIKGGDGSTYTAFIPWTNIDDALDLQ